jgi:hypothetical protein
MDTDWDEALVLVSWLANLKVDSKDMNGEVVFFVRVEVAEVGG